MMTFNTPGGQPPAGMPEGAEGAMPQAGGDEMEMIMEIAMMVLGHPPQNEQELMQVISVMASMQGGEGAAAVAGGRGAQTPPMPAANTALVKAVNGGF
jgi:hypothetical protein